MIVCSTCRVEKSENEFSFRKDRGEYRKQCKNCRNIQSAEWVSRNLDKRRDIALAWARRNMDYIRANKRKYRERDPIAARRWSLENPDKMQACRSRWAKNNSHRLTMKANATRARKKKAFVPWANLFFIEEIYHLAKLRTKATGIKWEVDHIVPMAGKTVSGLHWEQNMQVVPSAVNRRKSCYQWPDMP